MTVQRTPASSKVYEPRVSRMNCLNLRLYEESVSDLTDVESKRLKDLLTEFADTFSTHDLDIGCRKGVYHTIHIEDQPVEHRSKRTPIHFELEEEEHLDKLVEAGVLSP